MRFSVLLPCRDAQDTLAEAMDSILTQTLTDFEVLAVEDGSRDGTPAILGSYAARDPRVRILDNRGRGLVAALNLGLKMSRAPWVARMDADDRMHPRRLERQAAFLDHHPELVLSACQVRLFPEERIQGGMREYLRWQNACLSHEDLRDEIYVESPFAHPAVVFRHDAILALGGYREGPFPEDYDLWLRLHLRDAPMAKLPEVLLDWRDSDQRLSRTDPRCQREAFDHLRAEYLARDPRIQHRPLACWGAGRITRKRTRLLLRQGFRPQAWIDIDPAKIGNHIDGVPVVAPEWLKENRVFVLSYVSNHGARECIAGDLEEMGYRRGRDYLMVG